VYTGYRPKRKLIAKSKLQIEGADAKTSGQELGEVEVTKGARSRVDASSSSVQKSLAIRKGKGSAKNRAEKLR